MNSFCQVSRYCILYLALGILATSLVTGRATVVVVASPVERALAVVDALPSRATDQRVSPPAGRAGANWTVDARPVKAWLAAGSRSTGIGCAQVLFLKLSATDEGVAGVPSRTRADCLVVGRFTGGSLAADIGVWLKAGVLTPQPDASLVGGTIRVAGAFSVTS